MKRKMAFLLAVILTVSVSLMAYAVEADSVGQGQQNGAVSQDTEGEQDTRTVSGAVEPGTAQTPGEAGNPGEGSGPNGGAGNSGAQIGRAHV